MLLLTPVLILLGAAALISLLGLFRPRFTSHWLIAITSALAAWVVVWLLVLKLPLEFGLLEDISYRLALPALSFRGDEITWPLALAVSTVLLSVLFTDAARAVEASWLIWAGDLGFAAIGITAVLARNPATMMLAWLLVDLIEMSILLRQLEEERIRRRAVVFFATNLLGIVAVFGAMIAAGGAGVGLNLDQIPQQSVIYLILAVGLRMGVFPLQVAFLRDVHHQRSQGTLLRLIPPAVSLSLLAHSATTPLADGWRQMFIFFAVLAAVYGAIAWARAKNELRGRLFWIFGLAGMSFAAAVQGQQGAVLAWGLAILYPGSLLFLASVRTRGMLPLGILSLFALSAVPFSPTYAGLRLYYPFDMLLLLLPLAHVLLLGGYVRFMLRQTEPLSGVEPWVRVSYAIGLGILPVTFIASSFLGPKVPAAGPIPIWPLLLSFVGIATGVVGYWRRWKIPSKIFEYLDKVFSLRWMLTGLRWLDEFMGRFAALVTRLLEGDGGVLWTLVILVIFASLLGQLVSAGG
ncbi:MAG: hypothetical protein JW757_02550 [Anaerolineales bacterium]|nr:hypothetical protein [Anaerolineales bacterium]